MATVIDIPPKPGEVVRVRSRRYLVEEVEPAPTPGDQTLVRLSCLEDDAEGQEIQVLWEKEVDAQRINEADWSRLAGGNFDQPHLFAAYYHTLRWNSVTSTDPKLFQAPYRAGRGGLLGWSTSSQNQCVLDGGASRFRSGQNFAAARRETELLGQHGRRCRIHFEDDNEQATPLSRLRQLLDNPVNRTRLFPLVGGEDVNSLPTSESHRWIIDFGDLDEARAREWSELFAIVEQRVKPYRDTVKRDAHRARWWQYGDRRVELYRTLGSMNRVIVISGISSHCAFTLVPARQVFSNTAIVITFETGAALSIVQSRVHEAWARAFGSSMKDDFRYMPADCFETFAFPEGWQSNGALERNGTAYYNFRATLMVRNNEGLTKTYNRFHDPDERDPDILKLRDLHAAMDRAVLDAYGWAHIQPRCEFILDYEDEDDDTPGQPSRRKKPWRFRWPDEIRDEVLGRLLELNAQRAKEEALSGSAARAKSRTSLESKKRLSGPLLD